MCCSSIHWNVLQPWGKRARVTLNVFSPLTFIVVFLSSILPLSTASWHFWVRILSDLWPGIHIILTWITLSIHCLLKREKYLDLFPNFDWGNDMNQVSFDLRFRSFVWRFLCFLSSFLALSARVRSDGKYVMCLYVNPDQDFNSVLPHFSHSTQWLYSTLRFGKRECSMQRQLNMSFM